MTFISSEIKTQRTFEKHSSQKEKDFKPEILKKTCSHVRTSIWNCLVEYIPNEYHQKLNESE